jgi:glycosyltransferase involved in cell wall biosynthesis
MPSFHITMLRSQPLARFISLRIDDTQGVTTSSRPIAASVYSRCQCARTPTRPLRRALFNGSSAGLTPSGPNRRQQAGPSGPPTLLKPFAHHPQEPLGGKTEEAGAPRMALTPRAEPRIALVYGDYPPSPPNRVDGGADFLSHLAEGLVARGHAVTAIVSRREDRPASLVTEGGVRIAPVIRDWSLRGAFRGGLVDLRRVLKEDQIDVVHLVYPDPYLRYGTDSYHLPFLLKAASGRPLVVTFFGFGVTGSGLIAKAGLPTLFATANRIVITDPDLLRRFQHRLPWWAGKARGGLVGSISPGGSPIWSLGALPERRVAIGLRPDRRYVGFFGFWSPDKGLDELLEAIRRLRQKGEDVVLVLVGGRAPEVRFEHERRVIRLAEELGIAQSVIDTGPLAPDEVARHMVAMDLCALPFKVNPIGRSSLALSLTLGVPTVVTRPPGESGSLLSGLELLESSDPDAIATAIARLLDDPEAQLAAGAAAASAARHWSWDAIVGNYHALYHELAARGRS